MGIFDDWKLRILCAGFLSKGTYAWVESYDGGEDGTFLNQPGLEIHLLVNSVRNNLRDTLTFVRFTFVDDCFIFNSR